MDNVQKKRKEIVTVSYKPSSKLCSVRFKIVLCQHSPTLMSNTRTVARFLDTQHFVIRYNISHEIIASSMENG